MNKETINTLIGVLDANRQTGKTTALTMGAITYKETFPNSRPIIVTINCQTADTLRKRGVFAVPISSVYNLRGVREPILVESEVIKELVMDTLQRNSYLEQRVHDLEKSKAMLKDKLIGIINELH